MRLLKSRKKRELFEESSLFVEKQKMRQIISESRFFFPSPGQGKADRDRHFLRASNF